MVSPADVALVTERRYETLPADPDPYIGNIAREDEILTAALAAEGLSATRVDWSRPDVDWSQFSCVVLRTMWDYFERFDAFTAWLDRLEGLRVYNELSTVRWNMDKHYLADLSARGIATVPTRFFERGASVTLADALAQTGWTEAVLKPAVSGAARHTYRVSADAPATHQEILDELLAEEAMLLQPFMPDIVARGEVTVVVMDGQCTHAILKKAAPGDFRVQDDHGGTVHAHESSDAERDLARQAIAAVSPTPLYGRVDMVRADTGDLAVMELELIEPELWVRFAPDAATVMARGLRHRLG